MTDFIQVLQIARALQEQRRFDEAIAAYRHAIALSQGNLAPRAVQALYAIADIENNRGRPQLAVAPLIDALAIEPTSAPIHNFLARVYTAMGRHTDALPHHKKVAELVPDSDSAMNNFGVALQHAGRIGEAEMQLRRAIAINPASAVAFTNLGSVLREQGKAHEARQCYQRAMQLRPDSSAINSIYLYTLHFDPSMDHAAILQEHWSWVNRHLSAITPVTGHAPIDKDPDRKLRLGYISADFRQHVVGRFIEPILRHHSRDQFEVFCYSDTIAVDDLTHRLSTLANRWHNTAGMNDEQLAGLIAQDQIDLLLDTAGHMDGNRLGVFARQPAPVQISHIGYPASSGVPQIGFRITDRYLDPVPPGGSHETLLLMPDSFYLYANDIQVEPAEQPPLTKNGFVTFGSLNSPAKTSELAIEIWASVLRAVPDSRFLLLVPPDESANDFIARRFESHGIDRSRLILESTRPFDQYLRLYNTIDIALDPQPYGGGITSCDAMWMGVPVVTLVGKTSVGRIGATLMRNVGLGELVAESVEEYSQVAAALAADVNRVTEFRRSLRDRLCQSPLMDAVKYTINLEKLYRQAWKQFCGE